MLAGLVREGKMKSVIDRRYPLEETGAALEYLGPAMREERSLSPSTEHRDDRALARDELRADAFGHGFELRAELNLHPAESTAAATFAAAAQTARSVAADCLPLGIAIVMHLYPLCALRCVPLPWWSAANLQAHPAPACHRPPLADPRQCRQRARRRRACARDADAHCAVAFASTAPMNTCRSRTSPTSCCSARRSPAATAAMFCAADLHGDSVRIGTRDSAAACGCPTPAR